jgi:hypothetical protein
MFEESSEQSQLPSDDDSGSRTGRAPENPTPVAVDEEAAKDEWIRARNKRVRAPRSAPGPGGPPLFTNHSGRL